MYNAFKLEPGSIRSYTAHEDRGVFDKLYHVKCSLTTDQEEAIAYWLSHNCTENFIFTKNTSVIMAGGSTDHQVAWKRRRYRRREHETNDYHIKLYKTDMILFEMVWLSDLCSERI
jgi:hypothetical protein